MIQRADVVVVGGGILGSSIALHLVRAGAGTVALLERDGMGAGTSSAGAGFVALWAGGHVPVWDEKELALERYAVELYAELQQRQEIGYRQKGTVWAATTEQGWDERVAHIGANPLARTETIDGPELAARTGIVDGDAVYRAVFQPDGCQVSAGKAALALGDVFAAEGGIVESRRPVTGLRVTGDRVTGVDTPWGPVEAGAVVVAAGAWTNQLLEPIGCWLPMVPMVASRITTGPLGVPADMPPMVWPEFAGMWVRQEGEGLVWGCGYWSEPRFAFTVAPAPERFDQLPLDGVEEMRAWGRKAAKAMPVLAEPVSHTVAHGAPTYTPDIRGLVGPMTGIDGLFVAGGCNEAGVTHGPGYGRLLADLVVHGKSEFIDPSPLRVDRFGDQWAGQAELAEHFRTMIAEYEATRKAALAQ